MHFDAFSAALDDFVPSNASSQQLKRRTHRGSSASPPSHPPPPPPAHSSSQPMLVGATVTSRSGARGGEGATRQRSASQQQTIDHRRGLASSDRSSNPRQPAFSSVSPAPQAPYQQHQQHLRSQPLPTSAAATASQRESRAIRNNSSNTNTTAIIRPRDTSPSLPTSAAPLEPRGGARGSSQQQRGSPPLPPPPPLPLPPPASAADTQTIVDRAAEALNTLLGTFASEGVPITERPRRGGGSSANTTANTASSHRHRSPSNPMNASSSMRQPSSAQRGASNERRGGGGGGSGNSREITVGGSLSPSSSRNHRLLSAKHMSSSASAANNSNNHTSSNNTSTAVGVDIAKAQQRLFNKAIGVTTLRGNSRDGAALTSAAAAAIDRTVSIFGRSLIASVQHATGSGGQKVVHTMQHSDKLLLPPPSNANANASLLSPPAPTLITASHVWATNPLREAEGAVMVLALHMPSVRIRTEVMPMMTTTAAAGAAGVGSTDSVGGIKREYLHDVLVHIVTDQVPSPGGAVIIGSSHHPTTGFVTVAKQKPFMPSDGTALRSNNPSSSSSSSSPPSLQETLILVKGSLIAPFMRLVITPKRNVPPSTIRIVHVNVFAAETESIREMSVDAASMAMLSPPRQQHQYQQDYHHHHQQQQQQQHHANENAENDDGDNRGSGANHQNSSITTRVQRVSDLLSPLPQSNANNMSSGLGMGADDMASPLPTNPSILFPPPPPPMPTAAATALPPPASSSAAAITRVGNGGSSSSHERIMAAAAEALRACPPSARTSVVQPSIYTSNNSVGSRRSSVTALTALDGQPHDGRTEDEAFSDEMYTKTPPSSVLTRRRQPHNSSNGRLGNAEGDGAQEGTPAASFLDDSALNLVLSPNTPRIGGGGGGGGDSVNTSAVSGGAQSSAYWLTGTPTPAKRRRGGRAGGAEDDEVRPPHDQPPSHRQPTAASTASASASSASKLAEILFSSVKVNADTIATAVQSASPAEVTQLLAAMRERSIEQRGGADSNEAARNADNVNRQPSPAHISTSTTQQEHRASPASYKAFLSSPQRVKAAEDAAASAMAALERSRQRRREASAGLLREDEENDDDDDEEFARVPLSPPTGISRGSSSSSHQRVNAVEQRRRAQRELSGARSGSTVLTTEADANMRDPSVSMQPETRAASTIPMPQPLRSSPTATQNSSNKKGTDDAQKHYHSPSSSPPKQEHRHPATPPPTSSSPSSSSSLEAALIKQMQALQASFNELSREVKRREREEKQQHEERHHTKHLNEEEEKKGKEAEQKAKRENRRRNANNSGDEEKVESNTDAADDANDPSGNGDDGFSICLANTQRRRAIWDDVPTVRDLEALLALLSPPEESTAAAKKRARKLAKQGIGSKEEGKGEEGFEGSIVPICIQPTASVASSSPMTPQPPLSSAGKASPQSLLFPLLLPTPFNPADVAGYMSMPYDAFLISFNEEVLIRQREMEEEEVAAKKNRAGGSRNGRSFAALASAAAPSTYNTLFLAFGAFLAAVEEQYQPPVMMSADATLSTTPHHSMLLSRFNSTARGMVGGFDHPHELPGGGHHHQHYHHRRIEALGRCRFGFIVRVKGGGGAGGTSSGSGSSKTFILTTCSDTRLVEAIEDFNTANAKRNLHQLQRGHHQYPSSSSPPTPLLLHIKAWLDYPQRGFEALLEGIVGINARNRHALASLSSKANDNHHLLLNGRIAYFAALRPAEVRRALGVPALGGGGDDRDEGDGSFHPLLAFAIAPRPTSSLSSPSSSQAHSVTIPPTIWSGQCVRGSVEAHGTVLSCTFSPHTPRTWEARIGVGRGGDAEASVVGAAYTTRAPSAGRRDDARSGGRNHRRRGGEERRLRGRDGYDDEDGYASSSSSSASREDADGDVRVTARAAAVLRKEGQKNQITERTLTIRSGHILDLLVAMDEQRRGRDASSSAIFSSSSEDSDTSSTSSAIADGIDDDGGRGESPIELALLAEARAGVVLTASQLNRIVRIVGTAFIDRSIHEGRLFVVTSNGGSTASLPLPSSSSVFPSSSSVSRGFSSLSSLVLRAMVAALERGWESVAVWLEDGGEGGEGGNHLSFSSSTTSNVISSTALKHLVRATTQQWQFPLPRRVVLYTSDANGSVTAVMANSKTVAKLGFKERRV